MLNLTPQASKFDGVARDVDDHSNTFLNQPSDTEVLKKHSNKTEPAVRWLDHP